MARTHYRSSGDAIHDRIQQRVRARADREARAGVYCLCNHGESQHEDGVGPCSDCNCRNFEWDPTL